MTLTNMNNNLTSSYQQFNISKAEYKIMLDDEQYNFFYLGPHIILHIGVRALIIFEVT